MAVVDRAMYDALPETNIRVYRGQDRDAQRGLSWTLDVSIARRFAHGHRGIKNRHPIVLTASIAKADIAFAVADRREPEVVLFAPVGHPVARPNDSISAVASGMRSASS